MHAYTLCPASGKNYSHREISDLLGNSFAGAPVQIAFLGQLILSVGLARELGQNTGEFLRGSISHGTCETDEPREDHSRAEAQLFEFGQFEPSEQDLQDARSLVDSFEQDFSNATEIGSVACASTSAQPVTPPKRTSYPEGPRLKVR